MQKEANIEEIQKEVVERAWPLDLILKEKVRLSCGEESDTYVDFKKGYGNSEFLGALARGVKAIIDQDTTVIATAGYGGLPVAAVVAEKYGLKLTMIRDKPKNHGNGGMIDGYVPTSSDKVAIFDDVVTSGDSMRNMLKALEPTGAKLSCYALVNRGNPDIGMKIMHLTTIKALERT